MGLASSMKQVDAGVWRGPVPKTQADFHALMDKGIRSVLDLESYWFNAKLRRFQEAECASWSLNRSCLPIIPIMPPRLGTLVTAVYQLQEGSSIGRLRRPIYVHCRQGADRTGLVIAAYRGLVLGETYEKALADMMAHGFHHRFNFWLPTLEAFFREMGLEAC